MSELALQGGVGTLTPQAVLLDVRQQGGVAGLPLDSPVPSDACRLAQLHLSLARAAFPPHSFHTSQRRPGILGCSNPPQGEELTPWVGSLSGQPSAKSSTRTRPAGPFLCVGATQGLTEGLSWGLLVLS